MIGKLKQLARNKGYVLFTEPLKLNIWGFRSASIIPGEFDDEIHVFTNIANSVHDRIKWAYFVFKCTTDPGTYWLNNPMQQQGTAILAPNQYIDAYKIDKHRGKYYALCQRLKIVEVIRDFNRDSVLDFLSGVKTSGFYGINIHRARRQGETYIVDKWSAGCQVFKNAKDFEFFMKLCEMHRKVHGNKFTYTLVDEKLESRSLKRIAIGSLLAGMLVAGWFLVTSE